MHDGRGPLVASRRFFRGKQNDRLGRMRWLFGAREKWYRKDSSLALLGRKALPSSRPAALHKGEGEQGVGRHEGRGQRCKSVRARYLIDLG